jgi:hypothetical protein
VGRGGIWCGYQYRTCCESVVSKHAGFGAVRKWNVKNNGAENGCTT